MSRRTALAVLVLLAPWNTPLAAQEVEVIARAEIDERHPASLMDLLVQRAGISDSGGVLAIRGMPKVAVTVDGHPWDSTTVALNRIRIEDVERVDIYRGAASARFGADALGGAVAVQTRNHGARDQAVVSQGIDSLGGHALRAEAGTGPGDIRLGLAIEDSRRWRTFNIDAANDPFDYLAPVQRSYTDNRNAKAEAAWSGDGLAARMGVGLARDYYSWGRPNYHRQDDGINPQASATATWGETTLTGRLELRDTDIEVLRDKGGRDGTGLAPNLRLLADERTVVSSLELLHAPFRLGVSWNRDDEDTEQRDYATSARLFHMADAVERASIDGAVGGELAYGLRAELAGRWDRYRYLDISIDSPDAESYTPAAVVLNAFSPKISVGWNLGSGVDLHASFGKGFVPPGASALYYREINPTYAVLPNPGLQPERSRTWDGGMTMTQGHAKLTATVFHTLWQDKMESVVTPGSPTTSQMRNIGSSRSQGVELSLATEWDDGWSSEINTTLTDTRVLQSATADTIGNRLPNMPRHRSTVSLSRRWGDGWNARGQLAVVSSQFTDLRNLTVDENGYRWRKDGYWTMNTQVSHPLTISNTDLQVVLSVDNLFDRRYEKNFFEVDPGRFVMLRVAVEY